MRYYIDGFTLGHNPSPRGGGFTVFREKNFVCSHEILKVGFTNNEAELLGMLYAVVLAEPEDTIITDSQNTLSWVRNGKSKARPDLSNFCSFIKQLVKLKQLNLVWEGRELNLAGRYNEEYK